MYKYIASIVMAVYNVEPFLREAIDSVIKQNIGFENIQLILVDDGSVDGSGEICDEYGALYPNNIIVRHKENGGVSSARNEGLKYVEGQYVNFMDADDKLSGNTVRAACNFLDSHYEETDIVAFPMIFFDGRQGEHILNYKFNKGNRVIDLDKEWQNPQLSMSSTFVKAECILAHGFDTRLTYFEDAQVVQKILASKAALGVIKNAKYLYRRRSTGEQSAVQSAIYRKERYLPCMQYFHQELIDYFLKEYHYVPRFVQFLLMYDLQWRIDQREIPDEVLSQDEKESYYCAIKKALQNIDDDIIMLQRSIYREHKFFALTLKYGDKLTYCHRDSDVVCASPGGAVFKLSDSTVSLDFLSATDDGIILEGSVFIFNNLAEKVDVVLRCGDKLNQCEVSILPPPVTLLEHEFLYKLSFRSHLTIDRSAVNKIEVLLCSGNVLIPMHNIKYGQFFPLSLIFKNSYAHLGNWVVTRLPQNKLSVSSKEITSVKELERKLCKELWTGNKTGYRKAVIARFFLKAIRKIKHKPIWLISDRATRGDDNGEALYLYMRKKHPEIRCYFVINQNCNDYRRIKKSGPVLAKNSHLHKLLVLLCDYNISSQVASDIRNPFYKYEAPYHGLVPPDRYIFLQHGITQNDLSEIWNRRKENLAGFVTAAKPEWRSIIDGNYEYTEKQVWLTGFPRFDRLYNDNRKMIAIVPTWRRYLMGRINKRTGIWPLVPGFTGSSFYQFYNSLINHPRLLEFAEKYGYSLAVLLHPNLQPYANFFTTNSQVRMLGNDIAYRDLFAQCSLMLTDYSSTVFDFAYLRKPVVYCQMDYDEFYSGKHTVQKGYFDYERDGFGEVEYTLEDTVDRIIEYMENGCQLKEKYRERIDSFFAFNDHNNCQRVYEKIMELDNNQIKLQKV